MEYEPSWDSLDAHPTPESYRDAAFGVFVHYTPSGFVDDTADYRPEDLDPPTAFDADEWADLAVDAGARYMVLTAWHRGGFANYPSDLTAYSAERAGDRFDVLTPLAEALRERDVKVGTYVNWHLTPPGLADDPTWASGPHEAASERIRELVERYDPDVLWADSGWYPSADLGALDLLAWFYERAAERGQDVVANDRFGVEARHEWTSSRYGWFEDVDPADVPEGAYPAFWFDREALLDAAGGPAGHGDIYTGEHQAMDAVCAHPWETCLPLSRRWLWHRGREHKAAGELVRLLVDVVSKNGNLLLNVSPRPDGSILPEDRAVLERIGDWLAVNGEAIYGTRPLHPPDPDAGFVPEISWEEWPRDDWKRLCEHVASEGPLWYTRRGSVAYAVHDGWPGDEVVLEGVTPREGATVRLLGVDDPLAWERVDAGATDCIRVATPDEQPCEHCYAFRVPLAPGGD